MNFPATLCRSRSHVVLNLFVRVVVVAVGLRALGGAAQVGVGVICVGFGLGRRGSALFLGFANVPGGLVEGQGVLAVASEEEGVGGTAGRVVAGADRFDCDGDETEAKRASLKIMFPQ